VHVVPNMRRFCIISFLVPFYALMCLTVLLSSCMVNAVDSEEGHGMLAVTGKIRLVGNEPFTHLVITTDGGKDYLIQGDLEKELRAFQYQTVIVTGEKLPPKGEFKYRIEVREYSIPDSTK